jgi:hypothetical protein
MIETPVEYEDIPQISGTIEIPEAARGLCDTWGNFQNEPVKIIEENHGGNFIKIIIYKYETGFYYGFQLKLDKVIRQKIANIKDTPIDTEEKARRAARYELTGLTSEAKLRRVFIKFDKICYNQPELFDSFTGETGG